MTRMTVSAVTVRALTQLHVALLLVIVSLATTHASSYDYDMTHSFHLLDANSTSNSTTNSTNSTVIGYTNPCIANFSVTGVCAYYPTLDVTTVPSGLSNTGQWVLPANWPVYDPAATDAFNDVCNPLYWPSFSNPCSSVSGQKGTGSDQDILNSLIDTFYNSSNTFYRTKGDPEKAYGINSWCGWNVSAPDAKNAWGSKAFGVTQYVNSPPICLVVGATNNQTLKSFWYPTVDKMSLLQLTNSLAMPTSSTNSTTFNVSADWMWDASSMIQIEMNSGDPLHTNVTIRSPAVRRFIATNTADVTTGTALALNAAIVPFWTAIVNVDKGIVTSIGWDTDCSLCSTKYCTDGFCAIDITQCSWLGGPTDCDVKVYVAWAGTDSGGTPLLSTNQRLSQFRRWSFAGAFNTASNWLPGSQVSLPQDGSIADRPLTKTG